MFRYLCLSILALSTVLFATEQQPPTGVSVNAKSVVITTITTPTSGTTYDAGTATNLTTLAGTAASVQSISSCSWVNSAGGSGSATGTTSWSVASIPLTVGSNVITVSCVSSSSIVGQDVVTVTRTASGNNPISAERQAGGSTATPNAIWAQAGVVGGIPDRSGTVCATIAPYTGSPATINNAIAACASGGEVRLQAGTYTLSDSLRHHKSGVTLRGTGVTTRVLINGHSNYCGIGGSNESAIAFCSGAPGTIDGAAIGGSNLSVQDVTWTAPSYAQGADQIVLSSVSGLTAGPVGTGSMIIIAQANDASDGYPAAGDIFVCESASTACSNQGANNWGKSGFSQVEIKTVTAIAGTTVTISPGFEAPNWRSAPAHRAYWNNTILKNAGIEDIFFDVSGCACAALVMKDAVNSWFIGNSLVTTNISYTGGGLNRMFLLMTQHLTLRSNYTYGPRDSSFDRYAVNDALVSNNAIENNIYHAFIGSITPNDPGSSNVYAYNFAKNADLDPNPGTGFLSPCGSQLHSGTIFMPYFEGNDWMTVMGDVIHGVHYFATYFRNVFHATECVDTTTNNAVMLNTNNRFFNFVGNVFADPSQWTSYQTTAAFPSGSQLWSLNWKGSGSGTAVNDDTNVTRTLLRWMNWDTVTSSSDSGPNETTGIRKCIGAGNPVAACTASEVPSGITNYPNPVPGDTIPSSLYLSGQPAWYPSSVGGVSTPWPPIGPDVTSGTIANSGGHAYKNAARVCFDTTASHATYTSFDPDVKAFDRVTCYGSAK